MTTLLISWSEYTFITNYFLFASLLPSKSNKHIKVLSSFYWYLLFSEIVPLSELAKNDFNLAVSRYVDTYDGEFIRLNDLKGDKEKIDSKMDELNGKINDLMSDLNIGFKH